MITRSIRIFSLLAVIGIAFFCMWGPVALAVEPIRVASADPFIGANSVTGEPRRVTALSTGPGATSLYIIGADGQVWTKFYPAPQHPGEWTGWIPLGPNIFHRRPV